MKKYKIAVLDDYQNVALESADWSVLRDRADIAVLLRGVYIGFAKRSLGLLTLSASVLLVNETNPQKPRDGCQ